MEYEVKRCPVCHTEIPEGSKATYCSKSCSMYAFYRRHSKIKLSEECLCYYNSEVLCSKKECDKCGWNPVVERRRKEAQAWQLEKLMLMRS